LLGAPVMIFSASLGLKDLISAPPPVVDETETVAGALKLLNRRRALHLCVARAGRVVGMLSAERLQRSGANHTLSSLVSGPLTTVPLSASPLEAMRTLGVEKQQALPVSDGERIVGLITMSDCHFGLTAA